MEPMTVCIGILAADLRLTYTKYYYTYRSKTDILKTVFINLDNSVPCTTLCVGCLQNQLSVCG